MTAKSEKTNEATMLASDASTDGATRLIGLDIVDRKTREQDTHIEFTPDEVALPGYVESVERGYENTRWEALRVWRTRINPNG